MDGKGNKLIRKQSKTQGKYDINQKRKRLKEVKSNVLCLFWQRMKHDRELQMKTETNKSFDWSHITLH